MFDLNMSPIDYAKLQRKVSLKNALFDLQTKSWDDWDLKMNTDVLLEWHEQAIEKAFEEWYTKRMSEHWRHLN